MGEELRPGYWAVIPAKVRYDKELRPNAKLLYAEISALADSRGYCWASNEYLGQLFDIAARTVRELVAVLAKKGYVEVEVVRDPQTNEVLERRIWVDKPPLESAPPSGENPPDPSGEKSPDPSGENPPVEQSKVEFNNIPPKPPKGGRRRSVKKEPKKTADWKPERFEAFYAVYPWKTHRQEAIRAWDELKASDELLDIMAAGLSRHMASEDWQRGVGIPHPATWINGRYWENDVRRPTRVVPKSGTGRQWADD